VGNRSTSSCVTDRPTLYRLREVVFVVSIPRVIMLEVLWMGLIVQWQPSFKMIFLLMSITSSATIVINGLCYLLLLLWNDPLFLLTNSPQVFFVLSGVNLVVLQNLICLCKSICHRRFILFSNPWLKDLLQNQTMFTWGLTILVHFWTTVVQLAETSKVLEVTRVLLQLIRLLLLHILRYHRSVVICNIFSWLRLLCRWWVSKVLRKRGHAHFEIVNGLLCVLSVMEAKTSKVELLLVVVTAILVKCLVFEGVRQLKVHYSMLSRLFCRWLISTTSDLSLLLLIILVLTTAVYSGKRAITSGRNLSLYFFITFGVDDLCFVTNLVDALSHIVQHIV